jgi:hypothetical protein
VHYLRVMDYPEFFRKSIGRITGNIRRPRPSAQPPLRARRFPRSPARSPRGFNAEFLR